MAGSGIAWHQLVMALISRFAGAEAAMQVARMNLIDWAVSSPIVYASLRHGAQASDPAVAAAQGWAAENYQHEAPVAQMVAISGLAERTFKRRFMQATGMGPLDYVHHLRLEEAKQMLESSAEPIDAIAAEVGYSDASFFNRLFRRKVMMSPAQYRRRFVQATGMGPLDHVHHLRLEEAKQMLESEGTSIEAVAFEVGYRDASFFNRLFRRKVMMSPTQYRRRFGGLKLRLREAGGAISGA